MKDRTAKVKPTEAIVGFIKENSVESKLLTPLLESFWKPKGKSLRDYPPSKTVVRLRAVADRPEKAAVDELNMYPDSGSYTHDKQRLSEGSLSECEAYLDKQGFEKWVEIQLQSTEHRLRLPNGRLIEALEETVNGKPTVVKFEAKDEADIQAVMKLLGLSEADMILKNRAEMLAEKMESQK